jgi:hypothetical protein
VTWFKVDDGLFGHPKTRAAGNRAMGLWVMSGAYASRYLTDGFVDDEFIGHQRMGVRDAVRLAEVGLWHPVDGGWQFHQWEQSNPSRAQIERRREAERKKKQRQRADQPDDE